MASSQDSSVGPSHQGIAELTPSDRNWNEMQILLTESEIWNEEEDVRRWSELQRDPLRLSVGPASVGKSLPRRGSRIPIYTRRRHMSRRFDRQERKILESAEIKAEETADPSPTAPSQSVSQTESDVKPEEEGTLSGALGQLLQGHLLVWIALLKAVEGILLLISATTRSVTVRLESSSAGSLSAESSTGSLS